MKDAHLLNGAFVGVSRAWAHRASLSRSTLLSWYAQRHTEYRRLLIRCSQRPLKLASSSNFPTYWTAHLPGAAAALTLNPSQPDGLLSLSVPPGNHEVQLRLERSRAELAGQVISLVSVAMALLLALYSGYKRVCHACVL